MSFEPRSTDPADVYTMRLRYYFLSTSTSNDNHVIIGDIPFTVTEKVDTEVTMINGGD